METEVPLIYTSLGNVPIESLICTVKWELEQDALVFSETYTTKDTGTVVKRAAHVYLLQRPDIETQVGRLN